LRCGVIAYLDGFITFLEKHGDKIVGLGDLSRDILALRPDVEIRPEDELNIIQQEAEQAEVPRAL
jgi:hypothetical protein